MWRMQDANRVLTEAEWALFRNGLDLLRDSIEEDIRAETDDADTGIPVFDPGARLLVLTPPAPGTAWNKPRDVSPRVPTVPGRGRPEHHVTVRGNGGGRC